MADRTAFFAQRRLNERAGPLRPVKEIDRSVDPTKEIDRSVDPTKEIDRSRVIDRGSPTQVAADIFGMVTALGGHLVVAFVTPVSAASRGSSSGGIRSASPASPMDTSSAPLVVSSLIEAAMRKRIQAPS